jgi:hypothetical protein
VKLADRPRRNSMQAGTPASRTVWGLRRTVRCGRKSAAPKCSRRTVRLQPRTVRKSQNAEQGVQNKSYRNFTSGPSGGWRRTVREKNKSQNRPDCPHLEKNCPTAKGSSADCPLEPGGPSALKEPADSRTRLNQPRRADRPHPHRGLSADRVSETEQN